MGLDARRAYLFADPLDHARILAIDFHRLIRRIVDADVPIVFLAFPRLIYNGDYLFSRLRRHLPATVTAEQALAAHRALADPAKVRVESEVSSKVSASAHDELDEIAVRRELQRLRIASDQAKAVFEQVGGETSAELELVRGEAEAEPKRVRGEADAELERAHREVAMLRAAMQEQNETRSRSTAMLDSVILERNSLAKELADLKRSHDARGASLVATKAERDVLARLHAQLAAKLKP